MKIINKAIALSAIAAMLSSGLAFAQGPPNRGNDQGREHYVHHRNWKRGAHIAKSDWARGRQVDYRRYHLSRPPRGYQWREIDGNYVLAAVATGVIASVIVAAAAGH